MEAAALERLGAAMGREGRRPVRGRPACTQVWSGRGFVGRGSRGGEITPIGGSSTGEARGCHGPGGEVPGQGMSCSHSSLEWQGGRRVWLAGGETTPTRGRASYTHFARPAQPQRAPHTPLIARALTSYFLFITYYSYLLCPVRSTTGSALFFPSPFRFSFPSPLSL